MEPVDGFASKRNRQNGVNFNLPLTIGGEVSKFSPPCSRQGSDFECRLDGLTSEFVGFDLLF